MDSGAAGRMRVVRRAQVERQGPGLRVLSGPEGGLSPAEEQGARNLGAIAARLGPRVLRAETAPLAVLATLASMLEDGHPNA